MKTLSHVIWSNEARYLSHCSCCGAGVYTFVCPPKLTDLRLSDTSTDVVVRVGLHVLAREHQTAHHSVSCAPLTEQLSKRCLQPGNLRKCQVICEEIGKFQILAPEAFDARSV